MTRSTVDKPALAPAWGLRVAGAGRASHIYPGMQLEFKGSLQHCRFRAA